MSNKKIVGFGYKSRAGKDTAAKFLIQIGRMSGRFPNVQRVPFARKLKQVCYDLFSIYGLRDAEFYEKEENSHLRDVKLPGCNKTPVELWIAVGDTLRRTCCETLWIDYVLSTPCDLLIISDLRYPNEFKKIKELGGYCIKMVRDTCVEKGSDKYLDDIPDSEWDAVITNHGDSRGELFTKIEHFFNNVVCKD